MTYFFFVSMPFFILSSLCSADIAHNTKNNPLPSFFFNYRTFDDFTCNFDHDYLDPTVSSVSVNTHNDFFEIFCIFFQISQMIKNEKFSEEFIKLLSYKLGDCQNDERVCEDEVGSLQESKDYDESKILEYDNDDYYTTTDSLQQGLSHFGSHIIDKVLDKYSYNFQHLSFEKKDDLLFVTCVKSPIVDPVDSKDINNNTKLGRLPLNLGRELSEKLLDSKDNLINFFINELVDGTTEGFANFVLKNTLKSALKTSKTKRFILKYLRLANDLRKNITNNPLECIDTIEEILRNVLKDSSKVKFKKGNVSDETIECLVKKCIDLLK